MSPAPPPFSKAKNKRQRARAAGAHPDYWYPVCQESDLKPGTVVEAVFWKQSIAVFKTETTRTVHAVTNRCAHRHLKLSIGEVHGCKLVCPYHGWHYDGDGNVVDIPHETFGKAPKLKLRHFPVRIRYGLVWVFPGNPERIDVHPIPDVPQLEGPDRWACVPVVVDWDAHFSMIVENVVDFTHEWLHRKHKPFEGARLTRLETDEDRVECAYDCRVGRGGLTAHFVDHDEIDTEAMTLGYDYPHQWSNTGGEIRHWMFVLPIDEQRTKVFFLFYFARFKVPLTKIRLPRRLMEPLIKVANKVAIAPLLAEDGWAVEAEQVAWQQHWAKPVAELNPVVKAIQTLTVEKWKAHLATDAEPPGRTARR